MANSEQEILSGLAEIVNEAKRTGVVRQSIERAGFKGVRVAPA